MTMIDKGRRTTLFESLTWRLRLLSTREWLILAVAGLALLAYGFYVAGHGGLCSGERLQIQLDLERSNREIAAVASNDRAGQCVAYRHRRDLLARAADVTGRCGNETSARGSADYLADRNAQSRFYGSLVARQCADSSP